MPASAAYSQAKTEIERLVGRFAHNLDAYKRALDRLLRDLKAEEG